MDGQDYRYHEANSKRVANKGNFSLGPRENGPRCIEFVSDVSDKGVAKEPLQFFVDFINGNPFLLKILFSSTVISVQIFYEEGLSKESQGSENYSLEEKTLFLFVDIIQLHIVENRKDVPF